MNLSIFVKPQLQVDEQMESTLISRLKLIKLVIKVDSIFSKPLKSEVLPIFWNFLKTNFRTAKNIFVLIFILLIFLPVIACGQSDFSSNYELTMNKHILATGLTGVVFLTKTISDQSQNRVEKVLQTADGLVSQVAVLWE